MPNNNNSVTTGLVAAGAFCAGSLLTAAFYQKQTTAPKKALLFPATEGASSSSPATPSIKYPEYDYEKDPQGSFLKVCEMLISELVTHELPLKYDLPPKETQWIKEMLDYNVKGGKMNRGMMVVDAGVAIFKQQNQGKTPSNTDLCQLAVLGWSIEWLQAWLLVADDIMDSSVTRRGQACWYKKLEHIWYIAINDAVTMEALVFKIMKKHLGQHSHYIQLVDLMQETTLQTEMGQLSDTLCDVLELKDLTPARWQWIVQYKTSYYSFYLSVAFAMTFFQIDNAQAYNAARDILVIMGIYFQAQDDYLDCFATSEQLGKVGTDIADKKCGWLFTKAYHELANPQQVAFLDQHYGKCKVGSEEEEQIKQLYRDLKLPQIYQEYEQSSYTKIMEMKNSAQHGAVLEQAGVPWEVFQLFLEKVYKRSK